MEKDEEEGSLLEEIGSLIRDGEKIVENLLELEAEKSKIENLSKLRRRITAELDFLRKIHTGEVKVKASHLQCSNVPYYQSILSLLRKEKNVTAVQKVFQIKDPNDKGVKNSAGQRVEVDLVTNSGKVWLKVKALKPQTLQLVWQGSKSITEQAKLLLKCASLHPHHYAAPLIALYFEQGISVDVAADLQSLGVIVLGQLLDENSFEPIVVSNSVLEVQLKHKTLLSSLDERSVQITSSSISEDDLGDESNTEFLEVFHSEDLLPSKKVFLDVTSMLAYISEVVNGDTSIDSSDPIIQSQLIGERKQSSLPLFNKFMEGKELYVTSVAKKKFQDIVKVVGGTKEKQRGAALLAKLEEVKDEPSERALALPRNIRLKEQHISVFGTGILIFSQSAFLNVPSFLKADRYKATTMTSNYNFVRISKENGVSFSVFVHPARALTEQKTDFEREEKERLIQSASSI